MSILDTFENIQAAVIARKLCKNKREFGYKWLGRTHSYIDTMRRSRSRGLADTAMILHLKLLETFQIDLLAALYHAMCAEARQRTNNQGDQ